MSDASPWLTRKQAAVFMTDLGCPIAYATLMNWARKDNAGKGPPYTVAGWRTVRYHKEDLRKWVKDRIRRVA